MSTDYSTFSLAEVAADFAAIARDAQSGFGDLGEQQLNWRPDARRWSVAQCFDHLLRTNREMFQAMDAAASGSKPLTIWQRLPVLPGLFGAMLVKSQAPEARRKFTAPRKGEPASSAIDREIIGRFAAYQDEAAGRVRALEGRDAARIIMVSPFVSFLTYSVLDGCRLIATHQRRHFEQARRVRQETGFPQRAP
jgi:hypothetical protein